MTYTLGPYELLSGTVTLPRRGAWSAELEVGTDEDVPAGSLVLTAGELRLTGRVLSAAAFGGRARVQLVAGALDAGRWLDPAGWGREGLTFRTPWEATVQAAGGTVSSRTDPALLGRFLPAWYRRRARALWCLDLLAQAAGATWRCDDDGAVLLVADSWPEVALPADAEPESVDAEHVEVSLTDPLGALRPGTTVLGRRVVGVQYALTGEDCRALLAFERAGLEDDPATVGQRLLAQRDWQALTYAQPALGTVRAQNADGSVDVAIEGDAPSVVRCALTFPAPDCSLTVSAGAKVLVCWLGPQQPLALLWQGSGLGTLSIGGTRRVARESDTVAQGSALKTWMDAVTLALSVPPFVGTTLGAINSGSDKLKTG